MAWVLVKAIALAGTSLKALGKVSHFTGILDTFSSSSKNVTLFKLGDWIRLNVGGESFVTKKKTLSRVPSTLFTQLLEADKIIDISKMQMLKIRLLNQMNITVTPSTGKIQFGKKKEKDKEECEKDKEKEKEIEKENNNGNFEHNDLKKEIEKEEKIERELDEKREKDNTYDKDKLTDRPHHRTHKSIIKEHKEKFEKDQEGFWMIDRDPKFFPAILNYLRTATVTVEEEELDDLLVEAKFYQITPLIEYIEHTLLEKRRKKERKTILESDLKGFDNKPYFVISQSWVKLWKEFIYNGGHPPPSIDNSMLLDEEHNPLKSKEKGKDYIFVNHEVWMTWWLTYGGGPIIARKKQDLYGANVLSSLWHMIADSPKQQQIEDDNNTNGMEIMCEPEGAGKSDTPEDNVDHKKHK